MLDGQGPEMFVPYTHIANKMRGVTIHASVCVIV
jgi:hypothetical protein